MPSMDLGHVPIPGSAERQPGQLRKTSRACLLHDHGAMVLDGALADAEIRGDILAVMAGEDELHDLAQARPKARDATRRVLSSSEQLMSSALSAEWAKITRRQPRNIDLRQVCLIPDTPFATPMSPVPRRSRSIYSAI